MGQLVRVLPGLYPTRPADFGAIAGEDKELYVVFHTLEHALKEGLPNVLVHIHGVVFSCWIILLIVQTSLVTAGRVVGCLPIPVSDPETSHPGDGHCNLCVAHLNPYKSTDLPQATRERNLHYPWG